MASLSVPASQFGFKNSSSISNVAEVKQFFNNRLVKLGSPKNTDFFAIQPWDFLVPTLASSSKREQLDRILDRSFRFSSVSVHSSSTILDSPFTERFSPRKSRGRGLASDLFFSADGDSGDRASSHANNADSPRQQIADQDNWNNREEDNFRSTDPGETPSSHLPELRDVLTLLRRRWDEEANSGRQRRGPGNVFLVGTGPGDPELLTVKALRLMQTADLVLYDRLVSTDVLDLVHAGARLLYVGKTSGYHSRTQEEIHELLLNFAEAGATVVRLKGGDPLVFGRGGEEMEFLQEQGIKVNVIPGITAASGIAAELGIPLTHRGAANSVRFLTGHSRKGGDDPLYVAEQAADPDSTLVVYMGLASLQGLAAKLMAHGLPPATPAAAIERGTTPQQRTVFGALEALPELVSKAALVSPTLIFIGKVVALSPLWPSGVSETGEIANRSLFQRSTASTPSSPSREPATKGREPRDRRQRGPDPALPSEL